MGAARCFPWLALGLIGLQSGCAQNGGLGQNPALAQQPPTPAQQQALAMQQQQRDLQARAGSLDQSNDQLHAAVAQLQQQLQLRQTESDALREQLRGTTAQLAKLHEEKTQSEEKVQALTAATRRRVGASITPNNSLRETLPQIRLEGVEVRYDGDVVRIELATDKLFGADTIQWLPSAPEFLDSVVAQVRQTYPDQLIGVEGHTDNTPVRNQQFYHGHQLSAARALAVYDYLVTRSQFPGDQLMIVGHGGSHPVVSNATPAGKQRNRRVELVVYPEKYANR